MRSRSMPTDNGQKRGIPYAEGSQRFAHIDCLRAIAALMVVVLHGGELARPLKHSAVDAWLLAPVFSIDFGRAGVILFFAISGFVIPSSLRKGDAPGNFAIRRFFRLYPAYWLSILAALFAFWWYLDHRVAMMQIIANFTMLQLFLGYGDIQGLYWTLAVELTFYFLCYALFRMGLIANGLVIAGISLACAGAWYVLLTSRSGPFQGLYSFLPHSISDPQIEWFAYFSVMFFGATCRMIWDDAMTKAALVLGCLVGAFWLVVFPITGIYRFNQGDAQQFVLMKYGAYTLALYTFVIFGFWVRISNRTLAYIGAISFSLYLFHPSAAHVLLHAHALWAPDFVVTSAMFVLILVGVTILVSAGVYRFVEVPAIELGKRVCLRRNRKRRALAWTSPGCAENTGR